MNELVPSPGNADDGGEHNDVSTASKQATNAIFSNLSPTPSAINIDDLVTNECPSTFDEMFAKSPFHGRILEEFDNYWRNFQNAGNC